jgi:hypothetical protein
MKDITRSQAETKNLIEEKAQRPSETCQKASRQAFICKPTPNSDYADTTERIHNSSPTCEHSIRAASTKTTTADSNHPCEGGQGGGRMTTEDKWPTELQFSNRNPQKFLLPIYQPPWLRPSHVQFEGTTHGQKQHLGSSKAGALHSLAVSFHRPLSCFQDERMIWRRKSCSPPSHQKSKLQIL